jgi:hypothetical protein
MISDTIPQQIHNLTSCHLLGCHIPPVLRQQEQTSAFPTYEEDKK